MKKRVILISFLLLFDFSLLNHSLASSPTITDGCTYSNTCDSVRIIDALTVTKEVAYVGNAR